MTIGTAFQSRPLRWLFGFGFWTLLGLSFASQFYLSSAKAGLEVTWRQAVSYALKICVHPIPILSLKDLWQHAAIGPIPGQVVLIVGFLFHAGMAALAIFTLKGQRAVGRVV